MVRPCHWMSTSMSLTQASSGAIPRTSTVSPLRRGETALAAIHVAWNGNRILSIIALGSVTNRQHFSGAPRAKVVEALNAEGIPVAPIYSPLNKEPFIEESLNSRSFRAVFSD